MKNIIAYIRTAMADKILDALLEHGIGGVSVFQGRGFAPHAKEPPKNSFDTPDEDGFINVTKLEIMCSREEMSAIIDVIRKNAHTGRAGAGKIFVLDVDDAVDIRTGESGESVVR